MTMPFPKHDTDRVIGTSSFLENLRDRLAERTRTLPESLFVLRGIWDMKLWFQPEPQERLFSYDVYIAQTIREGCCYAFGDRSAFQHDVIGSDARYFRTDNYSQNIAILDAAYALVSAEPDRKHFLVGNSSQKAHTRVQIVVDEVEHCLSARQSRRVAVIGAIGTLIRELGRRNYDVVATDLDQTLIGSPLGGVIVEDGNKETLHHIEDSDVAVVTGMTLATNTLVPIVEAAAKANTSIVLLAETGAWFASEYHDLFGMDSVISEPFPFYIFSGHSELNIYRRHS